MDMNELARTIAQEVLKQLKAEQETAQSGAECVHVLAERDCTLAETVREHLGDEYEFCYFGEDMHGRTPCRYLLPYVSCADMAALATGRASGPIFTEVLRLLLLGREVEVLEFEYKAYGGTAPGPLYSLYEAHEQTLAGFGLKGFKPKQPDTIRFRETLVTGDSVMQARGAKVLMVPAGALVTPQAMEEARTLNLTIQKCL